MTYFFSFLDLTKQKNAQDIQKRLQSSTVLLEKLIVPQPIKELLTFYGTQMFIAVLTKSRHLSLTMVT